MKRIFYKACLLIAVILLLLVAAPITVLADSGGGENEFTQTVSGYEVTLVFENPVTVGENQIHVRVSDAHHAPISNADVEVSVVEGEAEHTEAEPTAKYDETASMSGMSEMSEQPAEAPAEEHEEMDMIALEASHESGEFAGEIVIGGAGDWLIRVHLTIQGELVEVDFPVNVASHQNGAGILVVFFTLNAAIIGTALILKPKPVSVQIMAEA